MNETNVIEDLTTCNSSIDGDTNSRLNLSNKRRRTMEGDEEEEWFTVGRDSKRKQRGQNTTQGEKKYQVCVTDKNKLPKQFALAKIMRTNNIEGITRVKYVNPFKILLDFSKDVQADTFINNEEIKKLNWRVQKTWEVGISYGLLQDIEIEMSNEELLENVVCDFEIASIKRLNRRQDDGSWVPSEKVRIGFVGNIIPRYVYLHHLRTEVEQFVFPVTQCSKCWRFGHMAKMCPSNKVKCPKCGNNHENCETDTYKCVNCGGDHLSLSKSCPTYLKERNVRQIMSNCNCSYQKALTLYAASAPPPPPPPPKVTGSQKMYVMHTKSTGNNNLQLNNNVAPLSSTYAQVTANNNNVQSKNNKKRRKKKTKIQIGMDGDDYLEVTDSETETDTDAELNEMDTENQGRKQDLEWGQYMKDLWVKLKMAIADSRSGNTFEDKVKIVFSSVKQWFVEVFLIVVAKIPIIKDILPLLTQYG